MCRLQAVAARVCRGGCKGAGSQGGWEREAGPGAWVSARSKRGSQPNGPPRARTLEEGAGPEAAQPHGGRKARVAVAVPHVERLAHVCRGRGEAGRREE